jgi:hypothetical protein
MATIDYCGNRAAILARKVRGYRKIPNKFQGQRKDKIMTKTNVTTQMVLDYFDGTMLRSEANAVKKLLVNVIESLLSQGNTAPNLADGGLISATLMSQHNIDIPVDYALDYFNNYAQKHLPHLFD